MVSLLSRPFENDTIAINDAAASDPCSFSILESESPRCWLVGAEYLGPEVFPTIPLKIILHPVLMASVKRSFLTA